VKEFSKLVYVCRSDDQKSCIVFLTHTVYVTALYCAVMCGVNELQFIESTSVLV